jgi:hypothetical protein
MSARLGNLNRKDGPLDDHVGNQVDPVEEPKPSSNQQIFHPSAMGVQSLIPNDRRSVFSRYANVAS